MADIKVVMLDQAIDEIADVVYFINRALSALNGLKTYGAIHVRKQLEDMLEETMYMRPLLGQDRQKIENASTD